MNKPEIKEDKYQVFLFTCPAAFPFVFARHPWFVVNKKGAVDRWEIFWKPERWEMRWGHLHKNFYSLFQGIPVFFFYGKYFWKHVELLGYVEGDENSMTKPIIDFIENSPNIYPYLNTYHLVGPNSNTYVQWVLRKFPEFKVKLPFNAFGKNYSISD
jgi:hypothetical protein